MNAPVKFVGLPDGPTRYVAELGREVRLFMDEPKKPALNWHVPLECRGDYRPKDLANYIDGRDYRTDAFGKVLCYGTTQAGERCSRKAVNRYPRCNMHGGALHPLDKIVTDDESAANDAQQKALSRFHQFKAGHITVDDLDDEELASCGFRGSDGRLYKPKNVPREMAQAFTKAIYDKAQEGLRALTVDAVTVIGEIMKNKANEPDIRLKAAFGVVERNLGKTPTIVAITADKPFQEVFTDVANLSREESRRRRREGSIDADSFDPERSDIIDANALPDTAIDSGQQSLESATSDKFHDGSDAGNNEQPAIARGSERDPAILAQTLVVKDFEYVDIQDNSEAIKKETRKRYAIRAAGGSIMGDGVPFIRQDTPLANGRIQIRFVKPEDVKVRIPNKAAEKKRKTYTLGDF